jgi:DNA (cytosine-5)-methyltransferase 3A
LFFEFVRLLKAIKPKYFLLENVRMKKEYLAVITEQVSACYPDYQGNDLFGGRIEPIFINSALVSAQSRQRYYWTNIPGIEQPEDKGIVLRDILEDEVEEHFEVGEHLQNNYEGGNQLNPKYVSQANTIHDANKKSGTICANTHGYANGYVETKPKQVGMAVDVSGHDILKRVYSPDGKSPTLNAHGGGNTEPKVVSGGAFRGRAYDKDGKRMDKDGISVANQTKQMLELRKDDKSNAITTVFKDSVVVDEQLTWRKLTPLECERLQTVPDNYTAGVSNTQRYKMLGNGWTVDVIAHILANMEL